MRFKFILLFNTLFLGSLLLTACDDKKPEVSAKDHLDLAQLYFKQGSFKASIIEGKNALQIEPNNVEILTTMATVLLKLNEGSAANNLLQKAIELDQNNQNIRLLLARSYLLQHKIFSARNTFKSINPSGITDISQYQTLHADLLLTSNEREDAKSWYLKAYQSNNNNIEAILGIARTALLLKQLDEVQKYSRLALDTSPTDIDALLWQAQVYMLQKNYSDAESILSRTMIELERYDTLTANKYAAIDMLAKALVAQGKIEESFTYSNYLAQSRPGQVQASYKDALNLVSKGGNLSEAESAFQEVLKQAPAHKPSGTILGLISYEKGNYTQAEDYLSKFANDENSPLKSKKILILTKIKLNKLDEAIDIISDNLKNYQNDSDLHALLGFSYLLKNDIEKSISSLKHAIKLSDKNTIYHTNLSRAYLANKETDLAIAEAKKALEIKPNSEHARTALISAYLNIKEYSKAKEVIKQWLIEQESSVAALNISASIEQESNNDKKATTLFLKVLTIEPYNLMANMNLVKYDLKDNNLNKAFDRLKLVINTYPENLQALSTLFKLSVSTNKTDQAIQIIDSANNKHPFAVNSRLVLAQLYLSTNQPDRSLVLLEDVIKLDNKNTQAFLLKAKALQTQNNLKAAKDTYLLTASLSPEDPVPYMELGRLYAREKDFKQAEAYANKSLVIQNDFIPAHLILTTVGLEQNDIAMASKSINIIKEKAPESHLPYEIEADISLRDKNYPAAINKLQQAWTKQQNVQLANKILLSYTLNHQPELAFEAWDELSKQHQKDLKIQLSYSLALQNAKLYKKAQTILETQLSTFPDNPIILNNLANLYLETKDKRALQTAKRALDLSPNSPAIQDTVGWIYTELHKDYDKGIPLLKRAYDLTSSVEIKNHLIKALSDAGRTSEADQLKTN